MGLGVQPDYAEQYGYDQQWTIQAMGPTIWRGQPAFETRTEGVTLELGLEELHIAAVRDRGVLRGHMEGQSGPVVRHVGVNEPPARWTALSVHLPYFRPMSRQAGPCSSRPSSTRL